MTDGVSFGFVRRATLGHLAILFFLGVASEIVTADANTNTNLLTLPDRGVLIGYAKTGEAIDVNGNDQIDADEAWTADPYSFAQPLVWFDGVIGGGEPWRGTSEYHPNRNTNWSDPNYVWNSGDDYQRSIEEMNSAGELEYILNRDFGIEPADSLSLYYLPRGYTYEEWWQYIEQTYLQAWLSLGPQVFATTSWGRGFSTLIPELKLENGSASASIQASYSGYGNWQTGSYSEGFILAIRAGETVEVQLTAPPNYSEAIVSSFELPTSGESVFLERGVHFFGVLAAWSYFPPVMPEDPNYYNPNNPYRAAQDSLALAISLVPVEAKNASRSAGMFSFEWSDRANRAVHVQRTTSLSSGVWSTVSSNVSTKSFTDTNPPSGAAFYRVIVP